MTTNDATLSEQVSLHAYDGNDPAWLDRISGWDPVARLGETFLLNAQVGEQALPHARLISPQALERVGSWLAGTLHEEFAIDESHDWAVRAALTDDETFNHLGFRVGDLPSAYEDWRFSTEIYALIGDTAFLLMNNQFVRYRRLSDEELGQVLSARTAPFHTVDDRTTGTVLVIAAVPGRLGAFGGLRGQRRSLVAAGEAIGHLQRLWEQASVGDQWSWEREFFDDACGRVFGLDGLERVPVAMAYQRELPRKEEE
ncbi:hypothetical protein BSZ39_10990 [Bowdeniella nasicola]|uniref:Uncharacterized protein n=1 Tax=Bowdeniella nasicola TaxID=208480 RepID=A0A1Q5PZW4_9ACTO|nr:hypothetical protein [Bowdeniella nasicola]OKL53164.1 hypothetical protein BSZ39_10990 [Bowdeniella nasicola]